MKHATRKPVREAARKSPSRALATKRQAKKSIPQKGRPQGSADLLQPLSFVGLVFADVTRDGRVVAAGMVRAQPNPETCLCQPITESGELGPEMYLLELEAMIDDQKSEESFLFFENMGAYESWRQLKAKTNVNQQ